MDAYYEWLRERREAPRLGSSPQALEAPPKLRRPRWASFSTSPALVPSVLGCGVLSLCAGPGFIACLTTS